MRRLLVVLLVLVNGAWMAFDGGRALVVGDYVTPSSGPYAGELGPWAEVLSSVGLDPRSLLVKSVFVFYGLAVVCLALAFARKVRWSRCGLLVALPLGLWYLPFGTVLNAVSIALLFTRELRQT
jgi:hypothetical protein